MAKPCSVCNHPDRASIEISLANGIALRVLGLRFGLDASQLSRHRSNHMDEELIHKLRVRGHRSDEELAKIRDIESRSLLDHFTWQRGRLYANADRARALGDDQGERAAMAEAGRLSQRIGNLLGEMGAHIVNNNTQINLVAMPVWHEFRTELAQEFRRDPDTVQRIAHVFEKIETRHLAASARFIEHERVAA
jgi:hypothetical protein